MTNTNIKAYCYASGHIGFGKKCPEGAIVFSEGNGKEWKNKIKVKCRLLYDNKTFVIPGVADAFLAKNTDRALRALGDFVVKINH